MAAARTEAWSADVDLLDQSLERRREILRGFHERIEIDNDDIDKGYPVLGRRIEIGGVSSSCEDSAVDQRVQRLDATVHHLGKTGDVGDPEHRQSRGFERPRGAAGGHELEAAIGKTARELDET